MVGEPRRLSGQACFPLGCISKMIGISRQLTGIPLAICRRSNENCRKIGYVATAPNLSGRIGLSLRSPKHDAVWARQLAAELKRRGHPAKRLLAQAGLDQRNLTADGARIPFAKHAAFFELAAKVTRDGCLGLHFGQTRDTRDAGLIG